VVTTLYVGMTAAAMMDLPSGAQAQSPAKINVTQRSYDALRTGWNPQETTLNVANVGSSSFKQLAQVLNLDGQIDAQPLLVTGQSITGKTGTYDVLYVATENNTVYAFDATTGATLTQRNLGAPVKASNLVGGKCQNNASTIGIGSTPAIDTSTNTMYVITFGVESGSPKYRLHRLDLSTLADTVPPVVVAATHTLNNGSIYTFAGSYSRQRSALLLANGNVYAAFASYCDLRPDASRGWLLSWQMRTLQRLPTGQLNNRLQRDPVRPTGTGYF
jgi:outer membrane protein assembly factor BamB